MPWQLAERLIRSYSNAGKLVLDCFAGTATTGVTALMTGRQYLLFEPWDEAIYHAERRLANMTRRLGCLPTIPPDKGNAAPTSLDLGVIATNPPHLSDKIPTSLDSGDVATNPPQLGDDALKTS